MKVATEVPLQVAKKAFRIMDFINIVAKTGNQNAVTDACMAMLCARTAVLGSLLNVKINLSAIHDEEFATPIKEEIGILEQEAKEKEEKLLNWLVI